MNKDNPIFEKKVGDKQHNLDIYQRFAYFIELSKKGEKEHKDCVKEDGTIDKKYMRKNKLKKLPFKEVHVSLYQPYGTLL